MIQFSLILLVSLLFSGNDQFRYEWKNITRAADYPPGYNYPVYPWGKKMVALTNGAWVSADGKTWKKTALPKSGTNNAYLSHVQFKGAIYALGEMTGNYELFTVSTKIKRTRDLESWEVVAETSNLPQRIFYATAVHEGKIWIFGGYDGRRYLNDVWHSEDAVHWQRVAAAAPRSPRTGGIATVFKNQIWLFGGGVIDGHVKMNAGSEREVWKTRDGKAWERVETNLDRNWGGTAVVFDNKLWLVGANRGGSFKSAVLISENGTNWTQLSAPWSPRGAVSAWVHEDKLYLTGGKSSHLENGETRFVYSNDVWAMARAK